MSTPFLGEIKLFAFNFAPRNWANCSGQTLTIAQNAALFSLLGTTYGGNGTTTFALPDLRGRVPIHFGAGPGLSNYVLGQSGGSENVTLSTGQMPAHTHPWVANNAAANSNSPGGNQLAVSGSPIYGGATNLTAMNPATVSPVGGSLAHTNLMPYAVANYCIALAGIFPSRN